MRSVPHRVVCLLGLDDGVFPRVGVVDGDDLLARAPVTGERDPRSEDRQLMLDAVLAATETLVVTYTGANEFSGQRRPPAVPLGELLDTLDLTAAPADTGATAGSAGSTAGAAVSRQVTVRHPLQPFDARNLTPGALVPGVPGVPFSFDTAARDGARAAAGPREPAQEFLDGVLPAPAPGSTSVDRVVPLDDLLAFYRHPVRGFLRQRLDVTLTRDDEPVQSGLPVEIDQLAQWSVGDRVLRDLLAGLDVARAKEREWRRGLLPPGHLGWRILRTITDQAGPIALEGRRLRTREARAVDVDLDLGDGRRLVGTVPEVYGDRLVPAAYSRLAGTHRLQSWLQLLALAAHDPDHSWTAHTLGRPTNGRSRESFSVSLLGPLDHTALSTLRELVAVRDRGLCEPLPLPLKSSLTYARQRRTSASRDDALRKVGWDWDDGRFPGERSDAAHVQVWGPGVELPGACPAPAAEEVEGETTRFGSLALRVWSPLLVAEQGSW
jgi:exodeoxyribonuclease V gamma subunit